jgi:hypothetical protein
MFAYSTNERSSRGIERHCRQDIAYRVITGNRVPDHATVARFIQRHQQPLVVGDHHLAVPDCVAAVLDPVGGQLRGGLLPVSPWQG